MPELYFIFLFKLNICLCVVLLRHKYLHRASFVLMLSLALADVLHGLVTTCFFYPPILLRQSPVPSSLFLKIKKYFLEFSWC